MSNGKDPNDGKQPPRDMKQSLQGLLECSLSVQNQPGANSSQATDQNASDYEARRAFLEEAFKAAAAGHPTERLKICLAVLNETKLPPSSEADQQQLEAAWEEVADIIENSDFAVDFMKMNGIKTIHSYLLLTGSQYDSMKEYAATALGRCSQNHPPIQLAAIEMGLIKLTTDLFVETDNRPLSLALLYAMSCMCRGNHRASSDFFQAGGVNALRRVLRCQDPKTLTRGGFFMRALADRFYKPLAPLFADMVHLLESSDKVEHEHIVFALHKILAHSFDTRNMDRIQQLCRRKLHTLANQECFEAQLEAYKAILIHNK